MFDPLVIAWGCVLLGGWLALAAFDYIKHETSERAVLETLSRGRPVRKHDLYRWISIRHGWFKRADLEAALARLENKRSVGWSANGYYLA